MHKLQFFSPASPPPMIVHTTQAAFIFMQNDNLPRPKILGQKSKNYHLGDSNKPPITERPMTDPGFWILGNPKGVNAIIHQNFPNPFKLQKFWFKLDLSSIISAKLNDTNPAHRCQNTYCLCVLGKAYAYIITQSRNVHINSCKTHAPLSLP